MASSTNSKEKFKVYQNPVLAHALYARSVRPSLLAFVAVTAISLASAVAFVYVIIEEGRVMEVVASNDMLRFLEYEIAKAIQIMVGVLFAAAMTAFLRALFLQKKADSVLYSSKFHPKCSNATLTEHQQELLGFSKKDLDYLETMFGFDSGSRAKQRPKTSKQALSPSKSVLAPVRHRPIPEKSHDMPSPLSSVSELGFAADQTNNNEKQESSPWSKDGFSYLKDEISTEEKLEEFLADVEEKLMESANEARAQRASASPQASTSTGSRITPIRPVRVSPTQNRFSSPPKGEGNLPAPMTMEQSIQAFKNLGLYPQIEDWRDKLRQWFSEYLLNPLVQKIENSHLQVMQAAAKLGVVINISKVGSDQPSALATDSYFSNNAANCWLTTLSLDEDGLLHQLRANLLQARDTSNSHPSLMGPQPQKDKPFNPQIQECLDAITEHLRLRALVKGEWVKGLLPQSSVRAEYTVQRIRELAEGTCVKKFEFERVDEFFYDKSNKRWVYELPTDSHLLLYLFCALLEHPQWMLHADPVNIYSGKNPLFVNVLPPKEHFPEKYVAVLSSPPKTFHAGSCVLVVGKRSPPIFALYWDKKLQFSLQGRTALWDAILLFCFRVKVAHGGMVRGISLASSAFNLLSIFETETEDDVL